MPAACGPSGAVLREPLREYIDEQSRKSSFQEGRLMVLLEAKSLSLRVPRPRRAAVVRCGAAGDAVPQRGSAPGARRNHRHSWL